MTATIAAITRITKTLPPHKAAQVLKFAQSLTAPAARGRKTQKQDDGDAAWERILNDSRPRPKLTAKLKEVDRLISEGKTRPLDFDRL